MTRRRLFAFLGTPAVASAQITTSSATLSSAAHKVLVLTPNGPMAAAIGSGLQITAAPGALTLAVQAGATGFQTHVRHVPVTVAADGSIAVTGLIALMRAGFTLMEGADFVRTSTGVQLTGQGWGAGENWSALVEV